MMMQVKCRVNKAVTASSSNSAKYLADRQTQSQASRAAYGEQYSRVPEAS